MQCTIIDEKFIPQGSGVPRTDTATTGKYHLTDIIRYIEHTMGWEYRGNWKAGMGVTMEVGFIWEDTLTHVFGNRMAARLDEVELDDIVGSPDGVGADPENSNVMALEEYKCTWKSAKILLVPGYTSAQLEIAIKAVTGNWNWMVQIKSYCKMFDLQVVVMRILYLMGDYKGSGPVYRVVRLPFTQQELDANWQMIITHRDQMVKESVKIEYK